MVEVMNGRCRDGTPCMSPQTCKAQDDEFCLRQRNQERHQVYVKTRKARLGGEEEGET